ncbi:MAG: FAD-dependent oxidoreductase, partial [Oscillospiraceae bacterium]
MSTFDVAIIGGGIAGMAAAQSARTRGANVIIINDGTTLGGNMLGESFCPVGFTNEFGKGLPTGRDYATNLEGNCQKSWVQIMNETVVVDILKLEFSFKLFCLSQNGGLEITANTVVFACGCLEKGKGNI